MRKLKKNQNEWQFWWEGESRTKTMGVVAKGLGKIDLYIASVARGKGP
jgi:ribosomal protein L28